MGLRDLRLEAALTQLELAQRAGVSKTTIVNIEAGRIEPHPPTVRKLAKALDVEPRVLVRHLRGAGQEEKLAA
jgi:DNA-binding XRE family transcriptional regulator